jgi:phospholipid N-methyltransferase
MEIKIPKNLEIKNLIEDNIRKSPKILEHKNAIYNIAKPVEELKKIKKSSTMEFYTNSYFISSEDDKTSIPAKSEILSTTSRKLEQEGANIKSFLKDQMQKKINRKSRNFKPYSSKNLKEIKYSSSLNLNKRILAYCRDKEKDKDEKCDNIAGYTYRCNQPSNKMENTSLITSIVEKVYSITPQNDESQESLQILNKRKIFQGLSNTNETSKLKSNKSSKNVNFNLNIVSLPSDESDESEEQEQKETESKLRNAKTLVNKDREILSFNNVYDSFSEEEEEKEYIDETNKFYIHPNNNFKVIWDTLSSILIIYSMFLTPYRLAFENDVEDSFYYIELFIEFIFFTDLILSFFTAYYRLDILVTNSRKIVWNYIKTYFFFDLLSSVPMGSIFFVLQKLALIDSGYKKMKSFTQLIRFYRLVKWVRILRLLKINKTENSKVWKIMNQIVNNVFLKFLIYFLIMVYFTSCIWCFIGKNEIEMNTVTNWIEKFNLDESSNFEIFVSAVYFVCATIFTIGYGDLVAANSLEKIFVSFLMIIGSLVWSFVLTSLSYFFALKDESKIAFEAKMKILGEISRDYNLSEKLADRVKKYLSFEFSTYNRDQVSLVETLPTNLKNNLLINMYQRHISTLKFFKDQSYDFIISVLPLLRCVSYLKNEYIINIGSHVEAIYMLYYGQLAVHLGSIYENYEIACIAASYHIGDILMYANDSSPYDVRVRSRRAEMLILNKQDFASLKLLFKDAVHKILTQSNIMYEEIEMKKIAAIEYHKIYGTMRDFKINLKNPVLDIRDSFIMSKADQEKLKLAVSKQEKEDVSAEENEDRSDDDSAVDSSFDSSNSNSSSKVLQNKKKSVGKSKSSLKNSKNEQNSKNSNNNNSNTSYFSKVYNINNEKNNNNLIIIKNLNINYDTSASHLNSMKINKDQEKSLKNPKRRSHSANDLLTAVKAKSLKSEIKSEIKDKLVQYFNNKEKQVWQFKKQAESFLNEINEKIVNEAILMKNKEIMSEYLKEVLKNEKFEEVKFKNLFGKLDKIENKLKNVKKIQLRISSNYKRHKTVFN